MNRHRKIAMGVLVTTVVAAGIGFAGAALAGNGPGPGGPGPGVDDRPAAGQRMDTLRQRPDDAPRYLDRAPRMGDGQGYGPGDGTCLPPAEGGDLTGEQADTLVAVAEEHALGSALYAAFADQYDTRVIDRIATAEARQWDALATVLERYGMDDVAAELTDGQFSDQLQARYEQLLADGSVDLQAALTVGQTLEQSQATGLEQALDLVNPADVTMVYEHLLAASDRQLTAFETWLDG